MTIRFDCPNCKTNYEVADDLGGKMIMCRACQKRGPVRSLTVTTPPSLAKPGASSVSRRKFLLIGGGVLSSLGAIATGAALARWRPWRKWGEEEQGRRRGGPPSGDGKDRQPRDRGDRPPRDRGDQAPKEQGKEPGA